MSKALAKKIDDLESLFSTREAQDSQCVYGLYDKSGLVKSIYQKDGEWIETDKEPFVKIPLKLEKVITNPKRFIVIVGGRGSGKSQNIAAIECERMNSKGIKVACFREFQVSIDDSVFSLLQNQINRHGLEGFTYPNGSVKNQNGAAAKFRGLARNPESMKSMDGFKDFWVEEAQTVSDNSLKLLTPTMRAKEGRIIFTANPASSEDAFSQRFIVPFRDALDRDGIYEDDMHLIIEMNWRDNPWFPAELEQERQWDYDNLPRALYDHIWEGKFNDSVENALIMSEWFDACIDAHIKLGFKPRGAIVGAHDPSDLGGDSKGLAIRHGSVITDVFEKVQGNINEGGDWATGLAIQNNVDAFTWDCDGMGVGLNRQVSKAFEGKNVSVSMFKGSEKPDFPDSIYEPCDGSPMRNQKKWKEVAKNKRAQYYLQLRDRCYRTYRAVVHGEYHDPDTLISFSSDIKILNRLRAELCRMPIKPNSNGLFELYTKPDMKSKFNMSSPNLGDSVMMLMRHVHKVNQQVRMPTPIRPMGRR
ncbi:MAG: PBSX family phage terminase large subunit [Candidatus Scalindua sp.]|nr:PBSX family phage terminase large subunit [Candidatus Scalindua sp.]